MPEPQEKPKPPVVTVVILAACAVCAPLLTQPSEGLVPKPYWDPAHIRTYCYGETENVEERLYSKDECGNLLRERLANDYAPRVLKCLPELAAPDRKHEFAALIDASYNAGWAGVCKSPMVLRMKAGNWVGGCNAFEGWYVSARNRKTGVRVIYRGLVRRRLEEKALCLKPES